jgi:hypothetical protein
MYGSGPTARISSGQRLAAPLDILLCRPTIRSMLRHWQPAAPLAACRGHFNVGVSTSALTSNA